jgi:quercetin dioxygenase-like cupin family protein
MRIRGRSVSLGLAVSLAFALPGVARGQAEAGQPFGRSTAEMKFVTIPPLPICAHGSVLSGDPTKGPSILYAKVAAGCTIPWHWHTANENLMMVSGAAEVSMKDAKSITLKPGGFAMMPSHHVHQFRCAAACGFYLYTEAAFDIHYVDAGGKEIAPADALKPLKETPATEMK